MLAFWTLMEQFDQEVLNDNEKRWEKSQESAETESPYSDSDKTSDENGNDQNEDLK